MKWIWVRHGETDLNRHGCYLGHLDVPLNDRGIQQIGRVVKECKAVTKIFSSDLLRCKQTAEMLAGSKEIQSTSALRELNFGEWEGKRYEEIMETEAALMTSWIRNPYSLSPPKGETLEQLGNRIDGWLIEACSGLLDDDVILVVSHGGPLRWLLSRWLQGDAKRFWDVRAVSHGEGFMLEWDGVHWGNPHFFGGKT